MSKELTELEWLHYYERIVRESNQTFRPNGFGIIETTLVEKDEIFENHNIKSFTELNERLCDYNELKFDDDIKQKKLKALKILKEWFEVFEDEYGCHLRTLFDIGRISEEEYKLLKEVLKDE